MKLLVVCALILLIQLVASAPIKLVASTAPPSRFLNFLTGNVWPNTGLPKSYRPPDDYWKNIPPVHANTAPQYSAVCGRNSSIEELDAYTMQTEQFLTTDGVNLYDAAVREMALALLGRISDAQKYEANTLIAAKTLQFLNIRASTACAGIMYYNQCKDTFQNGACGFCYGGVNGQKGVTVDNGHAYFFRLISDVYSYAGTIDARCPEKKLPWTWNDWRPVAGENAWANLIGPLQVAYMQAGKNINNIDDNSNAMKLATSLFSTIQLMQAPNGAIAYAPWNTYDENNPALGGTVSTENAASTLAGLKLLLFVLQNKQDTQYKGLIPQVQTVINNLLHYLKSAYDPSVGYFLQGGSYTVNGFQWNRDPASTFAVDCQTWVVSVLGVSTVDSWFGAGTSMSIWNTTKRLGGWGYNAQSNTVLGVGFSMNQAVKVLSGEWSFGAVNMLKIMANQLPNDAQSLTSEANKIRQAIDDYLTSHNNQLNSDVINYANKRYQIPFGWWANPIPSLASISWAVMVDSNFNPFVLGGNYSS